MRNLSPAHLQQSQPGGATQVHMFKADTDSQEEEEELLVQGRLVDSLEFPLLFPTEQPMSHSSVRVCLTDLVIVYVQHICFYCSEITICSYCQLIHPKIEKCFRNGS